MTRSLLLASAIGLIGSAGLLNACSPSNAQSNEAASASLDNAFGSNMVVQRGAPLNLRGSSEPGEELEIDFAGVSASTTADDQGRWSARFDDLPDEGTYRISLNGDVVAENVAIGDVFLCSGQSNMEFPANRTNNWGREYDQNDPDIRLFTAPKSPRAAPQTEFSGDPTWAPASSDIVPEFSAVCYFTAKEIKDYAGVPIGLIDASWGGSQIEAWLTLEELAAFGTFDDEIDLLAVYAEDQSAGAARFGAHWQSWWTQVNPDQPEVWNNPESYNWLSVPDAFGNWKSWGRDDLATYNGQLWYQTSFTLDEVSGDATISLGSIDEKDAVWINGNFVGSMFGWGDYRSYPVPAEYLTDGENSLVINIQSAWDQGGLLGPLEDLYLETESKKIQLENWQYFKPERAGLDAPSAPWESISGYSSLHNGMVAPLEGVSLKGALWYQGESNTGRSNVYASYLTALADGWSAMSGQTVPVIVFQLPEFGARAAEPTESGWANLRDQQRLAAQRDDIAYVVTMGTGDFYDIHPPNKQEVARRTRSVAAELFYGMEGEADWRRDPVSARQSGRTVIVTFSSPQRSLLSLSSDQVIGFELCDSEMCRFAPGQIDGATVSLTVPAGLQAERVRYNWADSPVGNLMDESMRPLGSFELRIR